MSRKAWGTLLFGIAAAIVVSTFVFVLMRGSSSAVQDTRFPDATPLAAATSEPIATGSVSIADTPVAAPSAPSPAAAPEASPAISQQPAAAPAPPTSASTSGPCGTLATPPATFTHVIWVWMENKTYSQVIGSSSAPYTTSLASQCGTASSYQEVGLPSLPNYIGATAGTTFGIADDDTPSSHVLTADNLFRQVRTAGLTEKSYQESMPSNCALSSSGTYAVKHNPAAYYTGGSDRTACQANDVPLGTTTSGAFISDLNNDTLPNFAFVTPDLCNDMHDCSVATGDGWLKTWLPKILASPAYQAGHTVVFVVFDEDSPMPNVIVSPFTKPGTVSTTAFSHYSLLRTTEEMLGIKTFLGSAFTASSMRSAFNLGGP